MLHMSTLPYITASVLDMLQLEGKVQLFSWI